jgi:segregation and condensation protein B
MQHEASPQTSGSFSSFILHPSSLSAASPPPLLRIIEAMLFAAAQPLTAEAAGGAIQDLSPADFRAAVEELARIYRRQNRPYAIQATAGGYVLALRPRFRDVQDRLQGSPREARLSRAALDVLALVAFRQPTSRSEIDSQRGADSAAYLRHLVRLGLVVAEPPAAGQTEPTYGTTPRFLELFGLQSLDDLPQTMELHEQ